MQITYNDVMAFLSILALVMGVVLLYHLIIIAFNMRRITKRADKVSEELESIVMKPLTAIDKAMDWMVGFLEGVHEAQAEQHKPKHSTRMKKSEDFEVVDL